jgi:hypothetical protein
MRSSAKFWQVFRRSNFLSEIAKADPSFLFAMFFILEEKTMNAQKRYAFQCVWPLLVVVLALLLTTGCSLVKIESPGEPLPRRDVNARIMTYDFARHLVDVVEETADTIVVESSDFMIQLNAIRWKIGALSATRDAVFQATPIFSLIDTWTFCRQMTLFFEEGNGKEMFGEWQSAVIYACDSLETEITQIARKSTSAKEYSEYLAFVDDYVSHHHLEDILFRRESTFPALKRHLGIPDSVAVSTVGTLPQVMDNFASSTMIIGEQFPKLTSWKTKLYLKDTGLDTLNVQEHLDSLTVLVDRLASVAENSPQLIDSSFKNLSTHLLPLLKNIDQQRLETLSALGMERAALSESIRQGRMEITADFERISKDLLDSALTHIRKTINSILFFAVIILIIVLGIPFTLGFIVGRTLKKGSVKDEKAL